MEGSFQPTGSEQESNRSSEGNLPRNELEVIQTAKPSARKGVIRRLREAKGWSQQALADKAIVSFKTISSLEQGKRAQLSTFRKVAEKLDVEPGELIEQDDPEPPSDTPPNTPPATSQEKQVKITLLIEIGLTVTLTLSIPFEDFDETEGIDRVSAFLKAVINSKNAIPITDVGPGSVKLTMLVDEEDAPRLMQAFADHKLDAIQATELSIPRKVALLFVAASGAQGSVNPIDLSVLPDDAFMLAMKRFQAAGIDVAIAGDDLITLKWTKNAGTSTAENFLFISDNPSSMWHTIEIAQTELLPPSFPCSITLRLKPNERNGDSSAVLGERLESLCLNHELLRPKVSRVNPTPVWSGEVALEIASAEDLRAMSEVVLNGFCGQPLTLVTKRTDTSLGTDLTIEATTNLSAGEWESVAKKLGNALGLAIDLPNTNSPSEKEW